MKQLKYVLLLWLLPLLATANSVHWLGDYNTALQKSHREHKPLLVLVVKPETPLCNTIIKDAFMNQPYIDAMNEKMIAVMVTYEGAQSYPIEMYYTTLFPTLFFVNSQKEIFMRKPMYGKDINTTTLSEILQKY